MQTNSYATPKSEDSVKISTSRKPFIARKVPETNGRVEKANETLIIYTRHEILDGSYSEFGTGIDLSDTRIRGDVW